MRAFITGGQGFAGGWLRRHLIERGHEVLAPRVDVTDPVAVLAAITESSPAWIFHLAAVSDPGEAAADPRRAELVNVGGTRNVLEAANRLAAPPVVLVTSSSAIYLPSSGPLREDSPTGGDAAYVLSKLAAEAVCADAIDSPLAVIVARPFNHTGPGQPAIRVVPALAAAVARSARTGEPVVAGRIDVRRDLTDVRDTVAAYEALAEARQAGIYNVCSGQPVLLRDVAVRLAELAGIAEPTIEIDEARVRPDDPEVIAGDPSRIQAVTGWQPIIPMDQTLADVLAAIEAEPDDESRP